MTLRPPRAGPRWSSLHGRRRSGPAGPRRSCLSGSLCYNPPREDYRRQARLEHGRRRSPAAAPEAARGRRRRHRGAGRTAGAAWCSSPAAPSPAGSTSSASPSGRGWSRPCRPPPRWGKAACSRTTSGCSPITSSPPPKYCSRATTSRAARATSTRATRSVACFHGRSCRSSTRTTRPPPTRSASATTTCSRRRWRSCSAPARLYCSPTRTGCTPATPAATLAPSWWSASTHPRELAALDVGGASQRGAGGMRGKVAAALMAGAAGVGTVIANGSRPGTLRDVAAGEPVGTFVAPAADACVRLQAVAPLCQTGAWYP